MVRDARSGRDGRAAGRRSAGPGRSSSQALCLSVLATPRTGAVGHPGLHTSKQRKVCRASALNKASRRATGGAAVPEACWRDTQQPLVAHSVGDSALPLSPGPLALLVRKQGPPGSGVRRACDGPCAEGTRTGCSLRGGRYGRHNQLPPPEDAGGRSVTRGPARSTSPVCPSGARGVTDWETGRTTTDLICPGLTGSWAMRLWL